ncbi:Cyanidin 3-O-glucoside 7-O-glucosyltransferase (acyl-glucose) [Frankliniella fusca]|uniref:beta-glucosidase n=1 Tax=Frankliniella fusca TaxID=407009 RepID=A0AAE1GRJ4_9NEOP|nr:Cyanidin 3-O-glucoside 7-O-glucosyltransferase (acyl-glucose) [Frankliniella fusca]
MGCKTVLLWLMIVGARAAVQRDSNADPGPMELPGDLLIGAGVAAIQVEGAWNEDGKSESNLDYLFHLGKLSSMGVTDPHAHDVAADSYHKYKEDISLAAALKVYRFSLSWPRILPNATASQPNPKGVQFYHDVIDEVLLHGMIPMVTVYHFDHPRVLEDNFKGWWSPEMIPLFKEYARFVFNEYGKKVKHWTTINEPNILCTYFANLHVISGLYTAEEVSNHYQCQVGLTILNLPATPNSTAPEDVYAAEAVNSLYAGTIYGPVVFGDYPQIAKDFAGEKLAPFSDAEKELLRDSTDYIGVNVYNGMKAAWRKPTAAERENADLLLGKTMEDLPNVAVDIPNPLGPQSVEFFEGIHPEYLRTAVLWVWQTYKKPLIITENGFGDVTGHGTKDQLRAAYHSVSLRTLVSTINSFGVKVISYCAWSLIDAFEWTGGMDRPFGLVYIDYKNKTLSRTLKESSEFWINLGETRMVPLIRPEYSSSSTTLKPIACLLLIRIVFNFIE